MKSCLHCGLASGAEDFCCNGCETVYHLLRDSGLERFYELGVGERPVDLGAINDTWLSALEQQLAGDSKRHDIDIDIANIHCAACVWLVQETFDRKARSSASIAEVELNPTLGRASLRLDSRFPLRDWLTELSSLGYPGGPATDEERGGNTGLLIRTVLCLALAGNVMMFALAEYLGLESGVIHNWTTTLTFIATTLSVLLGGTVFFRSSFAALRARMLHFDVPIAVGVALAYGGAFVRFFWGDGQVPYLDTVAVFIAFMLLGRYFQERAIERSRRRLLRQAGDEGLFTRLWRDEEEVLLPVKSIVEGDTVVLRRGDLVPVDCLVSMPIDASLDWINGESEPCAFVSGETVPAGAFYLGGQRADVVAKEAFSNSSVRRLLRRDAQPKARDEAFWSRVSTFYTLFVLVAGALAFVSSMVLGRGWHGAIEVTTAVLVVTCPCAFGIAIPLAREWAHAQLRSRGVFVRRAGALERLHGINRVVFDKTGTLTAEQLVLSSASQAALPSLLKTLSTKDRSALVAMCASQPHPKSKALQQALSGLPGTLYDASLSSAAREVPGRGIELVTRSAEYRLGSAAFVGALSVEESADLCFTRDGVLVASFSTEERLRPHAPATVSALHAAGLETYVLSGDRNLRVERVAAEAGITGKDAQGRQRVHGEVAPDGKAHFVEGFEDEGTLMIGDGLNDGPAFDAAHCSATPAAGRPFVASRCDFYLGQPGLNGVLDALGVAERLRQVVRLDLVIAIAYNTFAVALALLGLMRPWLAAILMPGVSLLTIGVTLVFLGPLTLRRKAQEPSWQERAATPSQSHIETVERSVQWK